ncbi:MAG TPA: M1 family metallopeptidase [Clostridia bacterium]|nr:M1 family metallopeptidase [Clostridia bacterium]
MRRAHHLLLLLIVAVSVASSSQAATQPARKVQPAPSQTTLSQRVVAYQIEGKYDAKTHTFDGVETLTYKNLTGQPLDKFPFHLYLNAFQPNSSMMKEIRWSGGSRDSKGKWDEKLAASNEIKSLEVVGMGDLTKQMKFISPDDGNPDDRTVFEVQLPRPVPPGADVQFKIAFKAKFGEPLERAGYKREYILAGQWFPKVGVWWKSSLSSPKGDPNETKPGWNCHQYHSATEFFADFGTFDVKLTLPQNFVFGSTGVVTSDKNNGDGTKTMTIHAEDVHDFAWTAAPDFQVVEDSVQLSTGTVKIRALMAPGHMGSAQRYITAAQGTMKKFDEWYGPYPYPQLTIVDPPSGAGATGGMEYPMFITADTSWLMPKSLLLPEIVTEHEFGHQYWYGMVGSNEFEDAWLDEGINSYAEVKALDALYGRATSILNSRLGVAGDREMQRVSYDTAADIDPLSRNAWQYGSFGSYGSVTYGKTATILLTLEHIIGEDMLRKALHTYFMKYRFQHPTEQDFMNTVNEVAGQDLTWYWQQAVYGTQTLDDRILSTTSDRMDWAVKNPSKEKKGETMYHSQVVVHRRGTFQFPVLLEVKFDNGETLREQWDGNDRWHKFSWEKKAKIVSAEIDPDHQVLLDKDEFNNSYVVKADRAATQKLTAYWQVFAQWFGQMLAWLT